jgi:hypothetical protein
VATPATPEIPVSWGELLDKITILAIKRERMSNPEALANVDHEYRLLQAIAAPALQIGAVALLTDDLRHVNEELWETEDAIRRHDAAGDFGPGFVSLARSV